MVELLEYEQWKEQYGGKLQPDAWHTISDLESDFKKLHGLDIHDEIEQVNQAEYKLYVQRINAGLTE